MHDWEPGIRSSGLFWTRAIDPDSVAADTDSGWAWMRARNMRIPDFHDFVNAVSPAPKTLPGHVSFAVRFAGDESARTDVRNDAFGFAGTFAPARAHIDFRASDDSSGVVYRSVAAGQKTVSGGIGHERNGRFFA